LTRKRSIGGDLSKLLSFGFKKTEGGSRRYAGVEEEEIPGCLLYNTRI
jgi:hypothetical protein